MRRLTRGLGYVALAAAAIMAAGGASAESRLFSVRTTMPGVTIVRATFNGHDLSVAGQNGGATFFRINNPGGAVSCTAAIRFFGSDGSSADAPVNFCANNWTLTVATTFGTPVAPSPVMPAPMAGQPVAIATDDPNVTISDVFISARPVPIAGRRDPYVQIFLPRGAGFQCSQDLGLALSDGRRIARQVDVCRSNSVVVVPLAGSGYAPPPPVFPAGQAQAGIQPLPPAPPPPAIQAPPAPMQQPVPPATPPMAAVPMQWLFAAPGGTAMVSYAVPGAGSGLFRAVCVGRMGSATVTLGVASADVRPGSSVTASLNAGGYRRTFSALGGPRDESDGSSHAVVSVPMSDPLWAALITERSLVIGVGNAPPTVISLAGSSPQVKQFLAACAQSGGGGLAPLPPAPAQGLAPIMPPSASGAGQLPLPPAALNGPVNYVCDDGSNLSASFANATVTVMEYGRPPMTLYQAPSEQGTRYVAGDAQLVGDGENVYWRRGGGYTVTCQPQ